MILSCTIVQNAEGLSPETHQKCWPLNGMWWLEKKLANWTILGEKSSKTFFPVSYSRPICSLGYEKYSYQVGQKRAYSGWIVLATIFRKEAEVIPKDTPYFTLSQFSEHVFLSDTVSLFTRGPSAKHTFRRRVWIMIESYADLNLDSIPNKDRGVA